MRTRKDRIKYAKNSKQGAVSRIKFKAFVSLLTVEDVRDEYQAKLGEAKQSLRLLIGQNDLLEEKIRTAPDDNEQILLEYASDIKRIAAEIDIRQLSFEILDDLNFLLSLLAASCDSSFKFEHYKKVLKAANDRKLDGLMRRETAAEEISKIISRALDENYAEARRNSRAVDEYETQRRQSREIDEEARKLAPRSNIDEKDIIRMIRGTSQSNNDNNNVNINKNNERRA